MTWADEGEPVSSCRTLRNLCSSLPATPHVSPSAEAAARTRGTTQRPVNPVAPNTTRSRRVGDEDDDEDGDDVDDCRGEVDCGDDDMIEAVGFRSP